MDKLTTRDIADVLNKLADVWEDYANYCEQRAEQIIRELEY